MRTLLLLFFAPSLPALAASHAVVRVEGMDCAGCEPKLAEALEALPFVEAAHASFAGGGACLDLSGDLDPEAVRAAVAEHAYTAEAVEAVETCPAELRPAPSAGKGGGRPGPWDDITGVDAVVVSHGEAVDLEAHLVAEHFTVIDFGAPWCGPCHAAAKTLAAYLGEHPDTAVRAVDLDAPDPKASFALPAAQQHLALVPGLPWFEVYDPRGRRVYKGGDVDKVIATIDRKRR